MKTFFKFAMGFEWIKKNPALPIAAPKLEPSESIPFTEEQLEILFKACDSYDGDGQRLKALGLLLLWSGLRVGDACTIGREKIIKMQSAGRSLYGLPRQAQTSTAQSPTMSPRR